MKGHITNIEQDAKENTDFRRVLYTGRHIQLVLMSLLPGEEIGEEVHEHLDQFIRVEAGQGQAVLDGATHNIADGTSVLVPAGTRHNIINISPDQQPLKLYTLYGPPEHKDGVVRHTRQDAEETEEHFDGKTTE
jgi:mannose-6-phosphate isomerase-like protein (cupin superfamily)